MLGEMSRWLGEAGRGLQRLVGALKTKEECVCDLHGSGLVTWVLSACLSQREKKRCWKDIQGEARITRKRVCLRPREKGSMYKAFGRYRAGGGTVRESF